MVTQHDLDALAATIERHYVFVDVAAAIADEVRAWDAVDGEPPFEAWTAALRTHDRHLRVAPSRPDRAPRDESGERARFLSTRVVDGVAVLTVAGLVDPDEPGRLAELDAALARVDRCAALVIDVRGSRGGWPTMVERIVGALFGEQEVHILDFVHRGGSERSASTPRASQRLATMPVAVLVDGGTASAAESLAYVLATTGRATIVGSKTAGAANPGDWFDTGVGMWTFVSTGAPIDPRTGTGWEAVGVPVDVPADAEDAEDAEDAAIAVVRAAVAAR